MRSVTHSPVQTRFRAVRGSFLSVPLSPVHLQSSLQAVAEDDSRADDVFDITNRVEKGAFWDGFIKRYNQGGVIVSVREGRRGFCPYSRMDPTRLHRIFRDREGEIDGSSLLRQPIKCLVIELDNQGRAVLSEQEYLKRCALDFYKAGDVVEGEVVGLQQYGAFVTVPSEDGVYRGVSGFIHITELSWDVVTRPESIVQIGHTSENPLKLLFLSGDKVTAYIKTIRKDTNQLELSMRHVDSDPLKESISSLLPMGDEALENMTWEKTESLLPELNVILETLRVEPGIEDVQPARQAEVQHKVSLVSTVEADGKLWSVMLQDLEIWLSKEVQDGFNLVAWSGRTLQEIHIQTQLSRDEVKDTLRGVIRRVL